MALYKGSRYAESIARDVMLVREDGVQVRTVYRRPEPSGVQKVTYYVWRAGDRIDRIANYFFNDPTMWWKIMDVNPDIPNAHQIDPGTKVRIPRG